MSSPGRSPAQRFWICLAAMLVAGACTSAGSSCTGLSPLPGGATFPEAQKTENIANLRLTQAGIDFLNTNWQPLLRGMLPDAGTSGNPTIGIPLKCQNIGTYGYIVDNGHPNASGVACTSTSCGWGDQKCDPDPNSPTYDAPQTVTASITNFHITDVPPDSVKVTLGLSVNTGNLYVDAFCATCRVNFNTGFQAPSDNTLKLGVQFSIDQKWFNLVDLKVTQLDGTDVCSSGPDGGCIDPADIQIQSPADAGACSDFTCAAVDYFKNNVAGFLGPFVHDAMLSIVNNQFCEPCGAIGQPNCPSGSYCSAGTCVDSQNTSACVPRLLGVEGRATLAAFVQNFGIPPDAQLDLSIGLGSSANVDAGINLGMRGGMLASVQNECVPPLPTPSVPTVPVPQFDREAPDSGTPYHMALGLSQPFLSQALFQAQQSGALCVNMSTAQVGLLSTGLIKTFLPSLGKLATRDGQDAPMMVSLRPGAPPSIDVGAGTIDPVTGQALEPLITLKMPKLSIDFYAQIDGRLARLFTITADVAMPLSMAISGCSSMSPAFGDMQQLITNVSVTNSELIAEDASLLGDLVPLALGMAQPAMAQLIKPISLPNFGNFKLQVNAVKGINANPSQPGSYYHLGVYGTLVAANAQCAEASPLLNATLDHGEIPTADQMKLTGKPLPIPAAVLAVGAQGPGTAEYSYRVDEGFWSEFHPSNDGLLRVSRDAFLLQGDHTIDVRARLREHPAGVSSMVRVNFRVDWDPPEIALVANRDANRLEVHARDVISAESTLQYAYKIGDGTWSQFGPARDIDLSAVEQAGGVTVRVKDEAGNVGEKSWKGLSTISHIASGTTSANVAQGCTSSGSPAGLLGLIALAGVLLARRRKA